MTAPQIRLALWGDRSGYLIAVLPPQGQEHLPPSQQTRRGTALVVGSVYRRSADGEEPQSWRAYLWPVAGGDVSPMQSCDAIDATTAEALEAKVRKRARGGPWWDAGTEETAATTGAAA